MICRYSLLALLVALTGCDGNSSVDAGGGDDAGNADGGDTDAGHLTLPDGGPGPVPIFRNEVEGSDDMIGRAALTIMGLPQFGGNPARCVACHAMTGATIRDWGTLSDTAWSTCLANLTPASRADSEAIVSCF